MALTDKLTAIGDAIRDKTGSTDLLTLDAMPTAISGITTGGGELPEEAFTITGSCSYRFANGGWDWFIENYGDKITTKDISNASNMFSYSKIKEIPFEINLSTTQNNGININSIFLSSYITTPPYISGKVGNMDAIFSSCYYMTEIPEDWIEKIDLSYVQKDSGTKMSGTFVNCFSLRKIPINLLRNLYNKTTSSSYSPYYSNFRSCYALDEIKEIAVVSPKLTSNMFTMSFQYVGRVNSITFATQEDGTPNSASWISQTISLTERVGYESNANNFTDYTAYHGITADKQVTDDASYQALKDDLDWWTTNVSYSRYNHDSAVETINSLPDTSAYLATAGGTNTIKFIGGAGSLTDGGAINTLTEEEIAVATAKGWTVTLS